MTSPLATYFRTVEDFLSLPPEKIDACLWDFGAWLKLNAVARDYAHLRPSDEPGVFGWIDDGKHEVKLVVHHVDGTKERMEWTKGRGGRMVRRRRQGGAK